MDNCDYYKGQDISLLKELPEPFIDLLGFCINRGSAAPRNIVQKWSCQRKTEPNYASTVYHQLKRVADNLSKVRHWHPMNIDYRLIENEQATWFIDPPYQHGGHLYTHSHIDYQELADWCLSRKGQIIICENTKADWLNFETLKSQHGQSNRSTECIYHRQST